MKNRMDDYSLHLKLRSACTEIDPDRKRLTRYELVKQNARFAGSGGISKNNRSAGFLPAYQDTVTGRVVLSCYEDGRPAPIHVFDSMPADWVEQRNPKGRILSLKSNVIAGFVHDGLFYTREAAAKKLRH